METKAQYRHIVGREERDLVVLELHDIVKKKKIDLKKFSFIGVLGSHTKQYSHDIDILFFPGKKSKLGETIIEIGKLYSVLEKEMKKHHPRYYVAACPRKAMQEMTYYLASLEEGTAGIIPIHSLFFTDYVSFKRFNPKDFERTIKKSLKTIHGDFSSIKELPTLPQKVLEPYFFLIDFEMMSRISTYPKHLVRASAESLMQYLHEKYGLKIAKKSPHSLNDIRKVILRMIRDLDKKTYG